MAAHPLQHDWYPRPLPDGVIIGPRSWLYSAFAFLHCQSHKPCGVRVGADTGIYNGTFFDLGPAGQVEIGDYCFISSEATVSGGVKIGANTFVGVNATIREHLNVGRDCIIGAGALIIRSAPDGSGHVEAGTKDSGIPSRRLRSLL